MHRRDLLKAMAAAVPLTIAGRVWAAPKADMRLLVVFLRGAYDAANVVRAARSRDRVKYEKHRKIRTSREKGHTRTLIAGTTMPVLFVTETN
jgi:uncharacterized protein (DUF1501 family)